MPSEVLRLDKCPASFSTTQDKFVLKLDYKLRTKLGAQGGNRTHMTVRPRDFKSLVSTIPPPGLARKCECQCEVRATSEFTV